MKSEQVPRPGNRISIDHDEGLPQLTLIPTCPSPESHPPPPTFGQHSSETSHNGAQTHILVSFCKAAVASGRLQSRCDPSSEASRRECGRWMRDERGWRSMKDEPQRMLLWRRVSANPASEVQAVRGLSPKAVCRDRGRCTRALSVCELRLRFFERGVERREGSRLEKKRLINFELW